MKYKVEIGSEKCVLTVEGEDIVLAEGCPNLVKTFTIDPSRSNVKYYPIERMWALELLHTKTKIEALNE